MTLDELSIGQSAKILSVGGEGALRQHFLDMGIIPEAELTLVKFAPLGDPIEIKIHGYSLTLRKDDAKKIGIEMTEPKESSDRADKKKEHKFHPQLSESEKKKGKKKEAKFKDGDILTFALVGNQNSGKTTLFNRLTGSNQHVGNFPGVTVERKDGKMIGYPNTKITDLPGIYSMSPYSSEEIVSRDFVLNEKPNAIINIVDASNIERNLYLTMQLIEMNTPMVLALNMMDEVRGNGGSIDINAMEAMLGIPVVPISAINNEGIDELISHAIHAAKYQDKPLKQDFCGKNDKGGAVHRCLHAIRHLIEDHTKKSGIPPKFAASKIAEGDEIILEKLELDNNEKETLEHILMQLEKERGLDKSAAIADMRFSFIKKVCEEAVIKPKESKERIRSLKIDNILTGKFTAIPMFIAIMTAIFVLTFNFIGPVLQGLLEELIDNITNAVGNFLESIGVNEVVRSLVTNGIFAGVGSVLSFMPVIVTLFFFLSVLEDSGYIARVAFFMDKLLRKIGLSGRSIVPLLIGYGCSVPAIMAARTLPSMRDRKMTILLTPFMSCTAKLPVYGFFVNAFFPGKGAFIITGLYILGIIMGILVALFYKKTFFKGEPVPFVMELPNYRMPGAKNVLRLIWEKAQDFISRAFTVIFFATIIVWFLKSFDLHFNLTEVTSESILAAISGTIEPLFAPLGLGDFRICTSLITGFIAKESVVSTLEVLFSTPGGIAAAITPLSAIALLVFSLLYTPCVAAIAAVKRELGGRWAVFMVLWQCAVAWLAALVVRAVCILLGM